MVDVMATNDAPVTEFQKMLAKLDGALSALRARQSLAEGDYETARRADVELLFVLKNLNDRLEKIERYQEGR
jgi:chromosome segregation ATPase